MPLIWSVTEEAISTLIKVLLGSLEVSNNYCYNKESRQQWFNLVTTMMLQQEETIKCMAVLLRSQFIKGRIILHKQEPHSMEIINNQLQTM
jgi:hypothetical protein